jgi:predicted component of type VI protein secretion system
LLAKADGNDKLTEKLQEILNNTEQLQKLATDAGITPGSGSDKEAETEASS